MKKRIMLSALAVAGIATIALASCGKSGYDVYTLNNLGNVEKIGTSELIFKENSEIPYLNLQDGVELMSLIRSNNLDDKKYNFTFKAEGNDFVISNERGAKCTLSTTNQTLVYDDYDMFASLILDTQDPLALIPVKPRNKALKQSSQDYHKGQSVTVDLKKYSKLDIYTKDNKCYLPLSVFNSSLLTATENVDLAFNGKDLYLVANEELQTKTPLGRIPSALGNKFRENAQKSSISQEFLEYYYQSLCFDFDNQYGLKDKFTSFDEFLTTHYKNEMLSTNPKTIDNYTAIALSYLNDGHTTLTDLSNLYEFGDNEIERSKASPVKCKWEDDDELFTKAKELSGIQNGLDYKGDTVFVQFAEFTTINEDLLYSTTSDKSDEDDDIGFPGLDFSLETDLIKANDTACMLSKLYKDLTTDQTKKNQVKNIVIDLTTNGGGSADSLLFSLCTLLGTVTVDMTNPVSGAYNHQSFQADINTDGKIDSNDKPLCDLGFNIYFLNSKYSFSSANAMPVLAKLNKPNVVMLGDKTAGGPCAVKYIVTPIGSAYVSSSLNVISKPKDGGYVNIDDGIAADFTLTEGQMLNRDYIVANINSWKLSN